MKEDHYDLIDKSAERRITTPKKPKSGNLLFVWSVNEFRVDRHTQDMAEVILLGSAPNQWPDWIVREGSYSPLTPAFEWFKENIKQH